MWWCDFVHFKTCDWTLLCAMCCLIGVNCKCWVVYRENWFRGSRWLFLVWRTTLNSSGKVGTLVKIREYRKPQKNLSRGSGSVLATEAGLFPPEDGAGEGFLPLGRDEARQNLSLSPLLFLTTFQTQKGIRTSPYDPFSVQQFRGRI